MTQKSDKIVAEEWLRLMKLASESTQEVIEQLKQEEARYSANTTPNDESRIPIAYNLEEAGLVTRVS